MNLLLDAHVLLWWQGDFERIGKEALGAIENTDNIIWVSAATVWEISIKKALGKLTLPDKWYESIQEDGFRELPITWSAAKLAGELPKHHSDPFDRMLIAQAVQNGLILVTHDDIIRSYDISTFRT
ncbi:MAG: type II toxin-antitoxin system VapC family toxin [Deltaproteobacteria bacterium]|nr:type II toxin-antitoxin system VapC family toxin [Deltaproteobacteria bacterium]